MNNGIWNINSNLYLNNTQNNIVLDVNQAYYKKICGHQQLQNLNYLDFFKMAII